MSAQPSQLTAKDRSTLQSRRALLFGTLLFTVGATLLRLYRLDQIPFGLHLDETYNLLDAFSLTQLPFWRWPLFFTSNFGREPLQIYLASIAQTILGPTHVAVRIVPALVSVALTPALIWLAWEMAPWLRVHRRIDFALWTGAASLTLLWAQMHARIFMRGGLFLLLEVLILAAFWRAWQGKPVADDKPRAAAPALHSSMPHRQSLPWWILLGFLAGLSVYTYLPARLLPGVFLLFVPLLLWQDRMAWPGSCCCPHCSAWTRPTLAAPLVRCPSLSSALAWVWIGSRRRPLDWAIAYRYRSSSPAIRCCWLRRC